MSLLYSIVTVVTIEHSIKTLFRPTPLKFTSKGPTITKKPKLKRKKIFGQKWFASLFPSLFCYSVTKMDFSCVAVFFLPLQF